MAEWWCTVDQICHRVGCHFGRFERLGTAIYIRAYYYIVLQYSQTRFTYKSNSNDLKPRSGDIHNSSLHDNILVVVKAIFMVSVDEIWHHKDKTDNHQITNTLVKHTAIMNNHKVIAIWFLCQSPTESSTLKIPIPPGQNKKQPINSPIY